MIYSFITFIIYSAFEITKMAFIWGVNNPEVVNPITLFWLVILSLLAPILIVLFKMIIISFILIKEVVQSRKDKLRLKKLKGGKNV